MVIHKGEKESTDRISVKRLTATAPNSGYHPLPTSTSTIIGHVALNEGIVGKCAYICGIHEILCVCKPGWRCKVQREPHGC